MNIFPIKKKMSLSLILAAIRSSVLLNIKHIPLYNPAFNSLKKKKKNPISLPWWEKVYCWADWTTEPALAPQSAFDSQEHPDLVSVASPGGLGRKCALHMPGNPGRESLNPPNHWTCPSSQSSGLMEEKGRKASVWASSLFWDRGWTEVRIWTVPVNSFLQRSLTLVSRFSSWICTFL